jgi:hypothetical protein
LLISAAAHCAGAEGTSYWDQEPYRIHATIVIDAPADVADNWAANLPSYLKRRAAAAIGPLWQPSVELAAGALGEHMLTEIESIDAKQLPQSGADSDKELLLVVSSTPWGYDLSAREYDRYVDRWGQTLRAATRQSDAVPEQLFSLAERAVRPLAQFRLDPANDRQVILVPRGASLPPASADYLWAAEGDAFLPLLRRTARDGKLAPGGCQAVPWTFIELSKVDSHEATGHVESGTSRPLAVRQRGKIEQVAIALRPDADATTAVRLQSRTDKTKPLVGYQLFSQNTGEKDTQLVGTSDQAGQVQVGPGKTMVQLLYIKSGGDLLARVPLVPGAESVVEVPIPDDDLRLDAAARVAALREDLVDLVARRNIFIARIRREIDAKHYDSARQLLSALDELPSRSQFMQLLELQARLHHTSDAQVQSQIDQLFAGMQAAIGKFLDSQPISDLHDQLREATQKQTVGS